jgi:ubiquinol-cytochrome c reductase cytochrome b subunit
MAGDYRYKPTNAFTRWLDSRLPVVRLLDETVLNFPTPKNLNYWYTFGGILTLMLAIQIVTGIVLAMHYTPHEKYAFDSVERIMRDVNYGYLLRYLHSNGASFFFIAVYIHMFRGLYYGSYKAPREVLWFLGVIIYLLMMATGFLGYTLPWGQMSFWGATVITNFFSAIPVVGESITQWLWGSFAVDNSTLQRFFSLHYLLPFVIAGVVVLHIWALHVPGNNNPLGIEVKSQADTVPFHPYYTVKDGFAIAVFLLAYFYFVFFNPNYLGHADNYIPADPLVTPSHIVPEWYYLPFYAILRSVPDKLAGVLLMFGSIFILFLLPWLDHSYVRSGAFRPLFRQAFVVFVLVCLGLGWVGAQTTDYKILDLGPNTAAVTKIVEKAKADGVTGEALLAVQKQAEEGNRRVFDATDLGRILTILYFSFFMIALPVIAMVEKPRPLPRSISEAVLAHGGGASPAHAAAHAPETRA